MRSIAITDFADWRNRARHLLLQAVHPQGVRFSEAGQEGLFVEPAGAPSSLPSTRNPPRHLVPKDFLSFAELVSLHTDPSRWNLLYSVLFRIAIGGEHDLLKVTVDPDVAALSAMEKAVGRDIHKMHAFVRFRKIVSDDKHEEYVAWYRPDHHIEKHVAPWFAQRFGAMHWAILTSRVSAFWDTKELRFADGVPRSSAPAGDELEGLWRTYYANIFNPARLNVMAMTKEMPVRHWNTLPEAAVIPQLVAAANGREQKMRTQIQTTAEPFVPAGANLPALAEAVKSCRGCDLYRCASQPVFGEGPSQSPVMLVGEQPGDKEDLQGRPFVGPAGQLLDQAMQEAGIDRSRVYVTNAVKHFKFEERGKRRIHSKPKGAEVAACRPWLTEEIGQVNPAIIVALGATAALSVGGREFAIQKERGRFLDIAGGRRLLVTVHPSFLLRVPEESRAQEYSRFVQDLALIVPTFSQAASNA